MASAKKVLAPVDPDVVVPPSVKAAADAAAALHQKLYPTAAAEPAAPVVAPVELPTPPVEPVAAAAPPEPVLPAAAPIEPVTLPGNQPPAPASEQTWEHKYNSMKGRFERSENANRQLSERLTGLEQVLATMAVTAPVPAAPTAAELTAASLITPEERAAYGDEFIAMAGKVAEEKWSPKVASLEGELKILRERLEGVGSYVNQTERDRMHSYLTQQCPNWLKINDNPAFISWLALPEPYSGVIKDTILQKAYAANDAPRVLAFFQGFLDQEAALAPRVEPTPVPAVPQPKVPLETFAAPGRAKTAAAAPVPAEKPILSRADVSQFYVDVANKKYVGRDDEKNRLDRMIIEAGNEGRIQ